MRIKLFLGVAALIAGGIAVRMLTKWSLDSEEFDFSDYDPYKDFDNLHDFLWN